MDEKSIDPVSWEEHLAEKWSIATCPECGLQRKHPKGGSVLCDPCRKLEESEEKTRADDWVAEQSRRHRRKQLENMPAVLTAAGIPKRYQAFTRESYETKFGAWADDDDLRALIDWEGTGADDWLAVFYGKYGRRKTGLATAVLVEQIKRGRDCLWLDMNEWLDKLEASFGNEFSELSQQLRTEYAASVEVLLLDDVGSIRGGRTGRREAQSWWRERVASLLRSREMHQRATLLTGNFSNIEELARIDASLPSRLAVDLAFEMTGPDRRLEK